MVTGRAGRRKHGKVVAELEPTSVAAGTDGMDGNGIEPIFLVGAARSGTSLLYKALCQHPEASYLSNWVRQFPGLPQLAALNRVAKWTPTLRQRVWFTDGNAYVYGRRRPPWERAFPMPVEGEPVFTRAGIPEQPGAQVSADAPAALRRSFETIRRFGGGSCVVSKRIANNRRIPLLHRAFPGARFVHIIRDGRAVAASLSRVNWWPSCTVSWYGGTPMDWQAEGRDPWELCARNWVEELADLERGLAVVAKPQVMEIGYEAFIAAPTATLNRVAAFGGLGASSRWEQAVARLRFPDRNDAWRESLDDEALRTIARIQAAALRRHGYLPDPV